MAEMMRVARLPREGMRKIICSLITKKDFIYQYSSFYLIDNCAYRQGSLTTVLGRAKALRPP